MKTMMFNGLLLFLMFMWTSADMETETKPTEEIQDQDYENEIRVDIQARRKSCRNIGGKCIKKNRDCPSNRPLKTKPGRPYCSKRRYCCYPEPPTERPIIEPDLTIPQLTEKLMDCDINSVFVKLIITGNNKTLLSGPSGIFSGDTYRTLRDLQLHGNYTPDVNIPETITDIRKNYQNKFLDAIMETDVMKITEKFLTNEGKINQSNNLRDKLDEMWFTLYSRANNKSIKGSSGFEHVFRGEIKKNKVTGFHNWVFFFHGQYNPTSPDIEYTQPIYSYLDLGSKGKIVQINFKWLTKPKKRGSMFIGSSPELDMAVYTICFLMMPNGTCPVSMAQKDFNIVTYTEQIKLVASAYPAVPS